jgi:hypothetical protein
MKYDIKTTYNQDTIALTHGWEGVGHDLLQQKTTEIINLKDQAIQEALNKLGWLSPEDSLALLNACCVFQDGFPAHSQHYKQARKDFERIMLKYKQEQGVEV